MGCLLSIVALFIKFGYLSEVCIVQYTCKIYCYAGFPKTQGRISELLQDMVGLRGWVWRCEGRVLDRYVRMIAYIMSII